MAVSNLECWNSLSGWAMESQAQEAARQVAPNVGLSGRLQGPQHTRPRMTAGGGSWGLCHPSHEAELPPSMGSVKEDACGAILQKGRGERLEGEWLKGNTCENENSGKVGRGEKGRKGRKHHKR